MRIYEALADAAVIDQLISISADWELESSTYGYRKNEIDDIVGKRIFLAEQNGNILGYLFGNACKSERASSIMPEGTEYFEIEELYVVPQRRSQGVGRALFMYAEQTVKGEGIRYIMLSTATKNYKSILHFYIDELGMYFWSARLFKKL